MMAFSGFRDRSVFFARRPKLEPEINLIALIDLLLVVLIFVLVSSTLTNWSQLGLNLSTSRAGTEIASSSLKVAVLRDGYIRVGETQLLNGLDAGAVVKAIVDAKAKLASTRSGEPSQEIASSQGQANPSSASPSMLIYADRLAPHGAVVRVMDAARQAGIERVGLVTEKR
jgi:biopolymer transport protein ExbD